MIVRATFDWIAVIKSKGAWTHTVVRLAISHCQ